MDVYIGIPVYNAEKTIIPVIKKVLKQKVEKIIVVNDGSGDNTAELLKKFNNKKIEYAEHLKNKGYGAAQKTIFETFFKLSRNNDDIVVLVHADGQTLPEEIYEFAMVFKRDPAVEIVLGSRVFSKRIVGKMPWIRKFGDKILTTIQNLCFGMELSTYASGYRAFKKSVLRKIDFANCHNRHSFDTDILVEANEKKVKMVEIPVTTVYGEEKSNFNMLDYGIKILSCALSYRFKKKKKDKK